MSRRNFILTFIPEDLNKDLMVAVDLFIKQNYKKALDIVETYEKKGSLKFRDQLSILILKGWIFLAMLQFKEVVQIGGLAYTLSQKLKDKIACFDALYFKSFAMFLGNIKSAKDYVLEAERLLISLVEISPIQLSRQKGDIEYLKTWLKITEGSLSKALEHAIPCLEIYTKLRNNAFIAFASMTLGFVYYMKGELEVGLEYAIRSLNLLKKMGNQNSLAECLGQVGFIYYNKGDLNQALKYCNQGLSLEGINDRAKVMLLRLIGNISRERGELDQALKYLKQALVLGEQVDYIFINVFTLTEIGATYRMMGDYDKALENLETALEISKKIGAIQGICYSLDFIVLINLDKNNREQANHYFAQLNKFIDKTDYRFMIQGYLLVKALVLKTKGRSQNRAEAEKLLKQVVEEEIMDPIFQSLSVVLLCDLLVEELSIYNDPEILEEINPLIDRLLLIAENQKSSFYLAETKLFQAKLALIQIEFEKAQRLMTEAQDIAEQHDLNLLAINISGEHDILLERLKEWEGLKEKNVPISDRINLASINGVMDRLQGKQLLETIELQDEQSILLLILAEGGLLIYSYSFTEEWKFDDELFGGFLTAFNSISDEIFAEGLDRVKFGQNTVLMESIENFILCYLFKGQTFPAKQKLNNLINRIQNTASILKNLDKYFKTSQVAELKDLPQIENLIKDIFIT